MEHSKLEPIRLNFKQIRSERQTYNYNIVTESLVNRDLKTLRKNINSKAYKEHITYLEITEDQLLDKCKEDRLFAKSVSRNISKIASRQGIKDETEQLTKCNITAKKCGISIEILTATELRPTKSGYIVSKKEMKEKQIKKHDCLKSFDGKISGKLNAFISAKVVIGSGGHQDNVFEEMDRLAEWWKEYKDEPEELLVILIDTDLTKKFTTMKEKYSSVNNVKIFDHIEFQQYMILEYYIDESI